MGTGNDADPLGQARGQPRVITTKMALNIGLFFTHGRDLQLLDRLSTQQSTAHDTTQPTALPTHQSKAFCIHDSQLQPVRHLGTADVLRKQQGVEAGVAGGQLVAVGAVTLDHTFEGAQAANGRPAVQRWEMARVDTF